MPEKQVVDESREDLRPGALRAALVLPLGEGRPFPAAGPGRLAAVRHGHSSAERDRAPPHRPRVRPDGRGHPGPLEADARSPGALAARHRPRRYRDPDGRRARAREGGRPARRPRPRGLHRAGLGVAPRVRRHDPRAAAEAGLLARLEPAALHDGPRPLPGGPPRLRAPLRGRTDLPGTLRRELVPALRDRRLGPRGRAPRDERDPLSRAVRRRRRARRGRRRDDAARDDARRHRPRDPSRRRAHGGAARAPRGPADHGPRDPDHRGPDPRRSGVRHGHRQGDAGARRQRLRLGPAPRAAVGRRHRRKREDDRRKRGSTPDSTASRRASASSPVSRRRGGSSRPSRTATTSATASVATR